MFVWAGSFQHEQHEQTVTNCLGAQVHALSEMDDKIGMSGAIHSHQTAAYISCLGGAAPVGLIDKSTRNQGTDDRQRHNYTFVSVVLVLGVILSIAIAAVFNSVSQTFGKCGAECICRTGYRSYGGTGSIQRLSGGSRLSDKYTYFVCLPRLPMRIWWSSSMNWNRSCQEPLL